MKEIIEEFEPLLDYIRGKIGIHRNENPNRSQQWKNLEIEVLKQIDLYPGGKDYLLCKPRMNYIEDANKDILMYLFSVAMKKLSNSEFKSDYLSMAPLNDIFEIISFASSDDKYMKDI